VSVRYPLAADLRGKRVLVVGGGGVASRKVEGLLGTGASIAVVALQSSEKISHWAELERISLRVGAFRPQDVEGAVLVFAATDDPETNRRVAEAAKHCGAWVNVADDPEGSDFFVPALLRKGKVSVAVSTEGASPALAAWLRDRISDAVPEGVERLAALLSVLRSDYSKNVSVGAWQKLFESEILSDLARNDHTAASAKLDEIFGPGTWDRLEAAMAMREES
jgi:precorrin-2 dehydrogenase/sirohydrochlorin ferrochelatase